MDKKVLNYRIIVEREGNVFVSYAPSLGISDFGKTVDLAVKNIEKAIKLYLKTLTELKKPIPSPDSDDFFVTSTKVEVAA